MSLTMNNNNFISTQNQESSLNSFYDSVSNTFDFASFNDYTSNYTSTNTNTLFLIDNCDEASFNFETFEGFVYFNNLRRLTINLKNTADLLGTLILSNIDYFELRSPTIPKYLFMTNNDTLSASIWKLF